MRSRSIGTVAVAAIAVMLAGASCDPAIPLVPTNHDPVATGLTVFPTTLGVGDSAIVVCNATDVDGDTLMYDWSSDCRMLKTGHVTGDLTISTFDHALVVHAGPCNRAPTDTGWVRCFVRDLRGGGADAGLVRIVVRQ